MGFINQIITRGHHLVHKNVLIVIGLFCFAYLYNVLQLDIYVYVYIYMIQSYFHVQEYLHTSIFMGLGFHLSNRIYHFLAIQEKHLQF